MYVKFDKKKRIRYCLSIYNSGTRFLSTEVKITQFPDDSVLKSFKILWNQIKSGRFSVVNVAILERINISGPYFLSAWPNPGKHH